MAELILGTVQLGLDYGINNKTGKPNSKESFKILDYAYNHGIYLLDTASAYGDSECIIGEYIRSTSNEFQIATKLPSFDNSLDFKDFIYNQLNSSLELLSKKFIDYYLIHNFSDIMENEGLLLLLNDLKISKKIYNVGVSLYAPSELKYLLSNHVNEIDFVQIPFNLFDSRWLKKDLLLRTKNHGIKIFVRSIFLQGLIFLDDKKEMDKIDSSLFKYINYITDLAKKKNVSISCLAMDYVKSFDEIDGILVGCDNIHQLKENVEQFNSEISINDVDKQGLINLTKDISENIIDPRKW